VSWPISRVLSRTIIRLGLQSLAGSSNLPGFNAGRAIRNPIWSCSGWSLPCNQLLPVVRCALTAPFHPYLLLAQVAVYSLLHLSSACAAQALPGTLPYGARTFLPLIIFIPAGDCSANSPGHSNRFDRLLQFYFDRLLY
jgi:hypothetical protein